MGFIRFVPKDTNYTFEGNLNDPDYEYKEFIFNSNELITVCHEYESNFILEDHPRNDSRMISFTVRCRGSNTNYHRFLMYIDDTNDLQYKYFIKHLFDKVNDETPVTIEYDFYQFNDAS